MINAFLGGEKLDVEFMTFSGGERNVKIKGYFVPHPFHRTPLSKKLPEGADLLVYAHVDSSDVLMDLILFTDAFNRLGMGTGHKVNKVLFIPYLPYARQDRVMVPGEALSSVVLAKLINLCEYDRVIVDDPHSDVAPSHIQNVSIFEQAENALQVLGEGFFDGSIIVAPDAGAIKKSSKLAKLVGHSDIGVGNKHRDLATGAITKTSYSGPDVAEKRVIMIDDICDGGRTFIELARVLRDQGAKEVVLYVTHGIFSQGADVFDGFIDEVYSSYPWKKNLENKNTKNIFKSVDCQVDFI